MKNKGDLPHPDVEKGRKRGKPQTALAKETIRRVKEKGSRSSCRL